MMAEELKTYVGAPGVLDLPGFSHLFSLFTSKFPNQDLAATLQASTTSEDILHAVRCVLMQEMSTVVALRDRQYRGINPGSITLLFGPHGSLSVRNVDPAGRRSILSTSLQSTLALHLAGGGVHTAKFSVDKSQSLSEFDAAAPILKTSPEPLSNTHWKPVARAGYDAVNYECEAPGLIAEIRFGAPSRYTWVLHTGSLRALRMLVQDADANHHEMMISYLASTPAQEVFRDVVFPYCQADSHFVRWAAYKYLMRFPSDRQELIEMGSRDPHPQLRAAFQRLL